MLDLDITLLREPKRFQEMCFRLARYEFPNAVALASSWDGGRDIVIFSRNLAGADDVVFQCKFLKHLIAAKPKIVASLDAFTRNVCPTARWILCIPVEPSGIFVDWLSSELEKRGIVGSLWGRSELLIRLEQHPDVLETFFFRVFAELSSYFRSEHLELYNPNYARIEARVGI